jgi:hypothetical protein
MKGWQGIILEEWVVAYFKKMISVTWLDWLKRNVKGLVQSNRNRIFNDENQLSNCWIYKKFILKVAYTLFTPAASYFCLCVQLFIVYDSLYWNLQHWTTHIMQCRNKRCFGFYIFWGRSATRHVTCADCLVIPHKVCPTVLIVSLHSLAVRTMEIQWQGNTNALRRLEVRI